MLSEAGSGETWSELLTTLYDGYESPLTFWKEWLPIAYVTIGPLVALLCCAKGKEGQAMAGARVLRQVGHVVKGANRLKGAKTIYTITPIAPRTRFGAATKVAPSGSPTKAELVAIAAAAEARSSELERKLAAVEAKMEMLVDQMAAHEQMAACGAATYIHTYINNGAPALAPAAGSLQTLPTPAKIPPPLKALKAARSQTPPRVGGARAGLSA